MERATPTEVEVPPGLPETRGATYNPLLHEDFQPSPAGSTQAELPAAARWRVRRRIAENGLVVGDDDDAPSPEYTLHRVIARGGFGEIWQATQEALGRVVAVKRLRQDLIDQYRLQPDHLMRLETAFRQEALVAAHLEHPNILPVHDLGVDDSGHLLLATKLVRGMPWSELVLRDRRLATGDFLDIHLSILEAVAQAVAFAHSRGVVHRDLKPAQVMVGQFGEVLLMDWGIAMFLDENPALDGMMPLALAGFVPTPRTVANPAGTVGYMAPEQTEPTPARIGRHTDVYLLGAILYELLTGHVPHEGDTRHASFYLAAQGAVPSPWEVAPNREIPAELAEIALACLEPDPMRRLPSVDELIARLREYRTGASRRREATELARRVAAQLADEPADYKALAHHQGLVARALSLWPACAEAESLHQQLALRHARLALGNHDLKLARLQAERLPEAHPERAPILAEVDRLEAEQAAAAARLAQALEQTRAAHTRADRLVSFLLEDLHSSLQQVNRLDLLGKVGREALDYFESLGEAASTAEFLAKRAIACRNIGDVFRDQGNIDGATTAFRNMLEISARLHAENPGDLQAACLHAEAHERRSGIEYIRGRLAESLTSLDEAAAILAPLQAAHPGNADIAFLAARVLHQRGIIHWRRRESHIALTIQTESLAVFERLAHEHPNNTEIRAALAWNLSTLGNVHRDLGRLDDAIGQTLAGLSIRQQLCALDPENKLRADDLCWSLTNLALLREYTGDFHGALDVYTQAGALRRRLVEGDPTNAVHRNKLTFILSSKGRNYYGLTRYADAARVAAEACALSRALVEADPANIHELGSHALNVAYYGLTLFAMGDLAQSRTIRDEAEAAARRALAAVPQNGVYQNALCQTLMLTGLLAEHDGDTPRAHHCWAEALELLDAQAWRRTTGQGYGLHLELSAYLGCHDDARSDAAQLRTNKWMMPRWEEVLRARGIKI